MTMSIIFVACDDDDDGSSAEKTSLILLLSGSTREDDWTRSGSLEHAWCFPLKTSWMRRLESVEVNVV